MQAISTLKGWVESWRRKYDRNILAIVYYSKSVVIIDIGPVFKEIQFFVDYTIGAQRQDWEWTRQNKQDQLWEAPLVPLHSGQQGGGDGEEKCCLEEVL